MLQENQENNEKLVEPMIAVDFIEVTYNFFKSNTFSKVQFSEIEAKFLPRKGDYVVIGSTHFRVEQVTFYPFGDCEGTKGVRVHISRV